MQSVSQDDPDRCIREANAATDAAEKQLFDAVIAHPLHQLNNHWWGRDLTSDLEEYERFLESRAYEIRRVIKATRSLFSTSADRTVA